MSQRTRVLAAFALLILAGGVRILLQLAAMPPYAGLDEIYHVARVNFVENEHRNPRADENSVAAYVHESLALEPGVLPDFVRAAPRWHEMAEEGYELPESSPVDPAKRTTYLTPSYQAQQASLYYTIAAPLSALGDGSRLAELRNLRFLSALLTLIAIVATGAIGWMVAGVRGIVATSLLLLLPTWHTLTVRVSNDALAIAALAVALAFTFRGSDRLAAEIAEAFFWAVALAAKLFTWPVLIVLPFVWWRQRPSKRRMAIVAVVCLVALAATSLELRSRTGVAVGLGAFQPPEAGSVEEQPIAYVEMIKITVSSAIWMSGQHNNALTSRGMALYVLPALAVLVLLFLLAPPRGERKHAALICLAALGAFGLAQAFHASAHIRNAKALGEAMPAAGKEGWYWYALAPLIIGVLIAPLFERVRCLFLVAATGWLLVWDVMITEGALFRDYAGLTSPEMSSPLFRWGPAPIVSLDLGRALEGLAAGPLAGWVLVFRAVSVVAIGGLLVIACRAAGEANVGGS